MTQRLRALAPFAANAVVRCRRLLRTVVAIACVVGGTFADAPGGDAGAAPAAGGKAVAVRQFSPQGEVAVVRQARATFSGAMVDFGDAKQPAPFDIGCAAAGTGRWVDDRTWVYDFANDVGPGTRCTFAVRSDLRSRDGADVAGKTSFAFSTGGPSIVRVFPSAGDGGPGIDEEQVFVLVLNGPATPASVLANAWCEVSGIGERVGVRLVDGADRLELLKRFSLANGADDRRGDKVTMLACTRRLPAGAKVGLVWGKGIAAASGVATTVPRRLQFEVRPDFTASFSCERENAQAACTPVRPVRLDFTSPLPREAAERFVLRFGDGGKTVERRPSFDADNRSASVSQIEFRPPFPETADLTVDRPADLVDDAGRPLSNPSLFPLRSRTAAAPPLAKFAAAPFGILELNAEPVLPLTVRHVESALTIRGVVVPGGAAPSPAASSAASPAASSQGTVRTVTVAADQGDAALIDWQRRVKRYHETTIAKDRVDAADLPNGVAPPTDRPRVGRHERTARQEAVAASVEEHDVATRELSLLRREPTARPLALPGARADDPRPFEVVGIPLPEPGFHVVEVESQRLGAALLGKPAPMYVRTTALVTNLGVHAKFGRVNAAVWVTTLDRARPVPGAAVQISDCHGRPLWSGTTDARGIAIAARPFPSLEDCGADDGEPGYFVSARKPIADGPQAGKTDLAFVWSNWNEGIESWRFNLPRSTGDDAYGEGDDAGPAVPGAPVLVFHTVLDRTLLRAGQTVSMKHFARREDLAALALPAAATLPTRVEIKHVGSDQTYDFDLAWRGGRYAETTFAVPQDAKLGSYTITLLRGGRRYDSGAFRVEEFRLPVMRGRIDVAPDNAAAGKTPRELVRPGAVTATVSIAYTNGGSASALPVRLSAAIKPREPEFAGYDGFRFGRAERTDDDAPTDDGDFVDDGPRFVRGPPGQRIVADKLAVALDKDGVGRVVLKDLPPIGAPRSLLVEATYPDPNGETQTLSQTVALWPASIAVGVKAEDWVSVRGPTAVRLVAVDHDGRPAAGVALELRGVARNVRSIRKRMVGGFYAYDNQRQSKELGVLCSGKSNARGEVACNVTLAEPGNVELVASAKDPAGNTADASTSVWVTRQAELWFGGENQDRIDVIPEKKAYAPGETARFQVRMPFRAATALVAIERDGVVATQVVEVRGVDPTIAVKVEADWAPNVFVSVLAVRGRIRDVPWYSFFVWGWKSPAEWWHAWRDEGKLYEPPTAMVDLGKPAFKYGIASIQVDAAAHKLNVAVTTDKTDYAIRTTARATIRVTLPDGKPAPAGTEVALAAVDEALLELMPNASWNLFDAMIRPRGYAVETATAQMQIVGKRHYGRKAAPAGGGGGVSPSRELFDTLLAWKPSVVLDANGSATVDVPLNDSLTAFRIVAIADAVVGTNVALFGTGSAQIRSRQDLQIVSGLPPLVREGDRYQAGITLRNTTKAAMDVDVVATLTPSRIDGAGGSAGGSPRATVATGAATATGGTGGRGSNDGAAGDPVERAGAGGATADRAIQTAAAAAPEERLPPQRIRLEAEASQRVDWPVTVPDGATTIAWRIDARSGSAADSIRIPQRVVPAIPVTVQQATLQQVDRTFTIPVAAPPDAVADAAGVLRGGLSIGLRPKLADGLPGVRDWLLQYPYACLEQKASIALGLADEARWNDVARQIPLYLDSDGLASYFPPRADDAATGSDVLTAYLLSASSEAGAGGDGASPARPAAGGTAAAARRFAIPEATRARMEAGLVAFVEGRIKRDAWTPRSNDAQRQLDVRKLSAIEALSRTDKATPRMLQSLQILPNQWPTSAVIDWLLILKRLPTAPERAQRLAEADQILRARLDYQGTRLDFSTEKDDFWYWLMASGDGNAARLLLAIVDDPAWKDDVPRLVVGMLQRQSRGHWLTTTANVWGSFAVDRFSRRFERDAVVGTTRATIVDAAAKPGDIAGNKGSERGNDGGVNDGGNSRSDKGIDRGSDKGSDKAVGEGVAKAVDKAKSPSDQRLDWSRSPQGGMLMLPWPSKDASAARRDLRIDQDGSGRPWATVRSLAAVPLKAPFSSGYRITRTITPVEQKTKDRYTVGDVVRIRLDVDAQTDMSWVVLSDPIPGGATVLGTGLGRDSQLAAGGEQRAGWVWPTYEEKSFEAYRSYYRYVPKGRFTTEYTVRLNNVGKFGLPPTRVEAMYAPEMYGEVPNGVVEVGP